MKDRKTAVLLACHNRKNKTLACLSSFFEADLPDGHRFDIFLADDGSSDGTGQAVLENFPAVNLVHGDGNLFWAGGMRLAWSTALNHGDYDSFLLLNDDVVLKKDFIKNLMSAEQCAVEQSGRKGIYSGATSDQRNGKTTYGSSKIRINHFIMKSDLLAPGKEPQACEITNANILWVDKNVVDKIGILDERFTHGIADYDYSLRACRNGFPVYLAPNVCGTCSYDHGNNWKPASVSLKKRIDYLKSPKGLAYSEYLYYVRRHFPMSLPYSFVMLWMKTLFPSLWDHYKKNTGTI